EEPLDVLTVTAQYLGAAGETAGALGRLLLQDVGAERLPAADLAGPGDFEALGRAPVGLHLRHRCSSPAGDGRRKITRWARLEPTRPGPGADAAAPSGAPGGGGGADGAVGRGLGDPAPLGSCFLTGARTINMLRPSTRGAASTLPTSLTCSAIRSRIRLPSSGWAISHPRNMIVILTFEPSLRNRSTCFVFVVYSCSSILGRNFISLITTDRK